jgi:hypothetical protein
VQGREFLNASTLRAETFRINQQQPQSAGKSANFSQPVEIYTTPFDLTGFLATESIEDTE